MATTKATFTLDEETVVRLNTAAERLGKPKSEIVREAIHDYVDRIGKLSERERVRLLRIFDEMVPKIPKRPLSEVEAEIAEIRAARRGGGRRTPVD
jgi:metal-responsive CopG/Arc/MetJ family transcriptional regulator